MKYLYLNVSYNRAQPCLVFINNNNNNKMFNPLIITRIPLCRSHTIHLHKLCGAHKLTQAQNLLGTVKINSQVWGAAQRRDRTHTTHIIMFELFSKYLVEIILFVLNVLEKMCACLHSIRFIFVNTYSFYLVLREYLLLRNLFFFFSLISNRYILIKLLVGRIVLYLTENYVY